MDTVNRKNDPLIVVPQRLREMGFKKLEHLMAAMITVMPEGKQKTEAMSHYRNLCDGYKNPKCCEGARELAMMRIWIAEHDSPGV